MLEEEFCVWVTKGSVKTDWPLNVALTGQEFGDGCEAKDFGMLLMLWKTGVPMRWYVRNAEFALEEQQSNRIKC